MAEAGLSENTRFCFFYLKLYLRKNTMSGKYSKKYLIRTYECDKNSDLRLVTLMNIFQDMADSQATLLGLGLEFCLHNGMAWVGSNYHLQITRMPKLHEEVTVTTWPAVEKKLGAIRDFLVTDSSGNDIIRASSQWILIDVSKKRPISLHDNLPQYRVVEDRVMPEDFNSRLNDITKEDYRLSFNVRFDDIDINHHVNNAIYPLWASEAVPTDFRQNKHIAELEIAFKKEGLYGEKVDVITQIDGNETLHRILATSDGRELSRVRIFWK